MFFNNLLRFLESKIKRYKDEKKLELSQREAILLDVKKAVKLKDFQEANRKFIEKEYEAERKFIGRVYEALTNYVYKVVEYFKKKL